MDWKTFIVEVTKALSWPLTVVGLGIVLRHPAASLIRLLRTARYKGLELEFDEMVESTRRAVIVHEVTKEPLDQITPRRQDELANLIVNKLDRTERTLLILHYYEGLDPKELSVVFDLSEAEIAKRLDSVKEKLREMLHAADRRD